MPVRTYLSPPLLRVLPDSLSDSLQLIILTGYPCSGLSYRAHQLSRLLETIQDSLPTTPKTRYKIHVVASHDTSHPRTVYDAARSEKEARAVVYGRVKRVLGRDSIVIVDGMNYIKGWRYQLWCESKAAATTCCVVCLALSPYVPLLSPVGSVSVYN